MKLVAVYIEDEQKDLERTVDDLVADLQSRRVEVLEYSCSRYTVLTPHVYIQLSSDLNKFVGRKFDVVLGPVPSNLHLDMLKNPSGVIFEGDVIEYVLRIEDLNE